MNRRRFLRNLALLYPAAKSHRIAFAAMARAERPSSDRDIAAHILRWRGFNFQGRFASPEHPYSGPAYEEFDFATMAGWGFDFARLPLSYWAWGSRDDWSVIREEPLKQIDRAIELGKQHGVHINLNFHRTPGYCINQRELEPADIFTGTKVERDRALAATVYHWKYFARRYKGIPNRQLSFDLINEPPKMRSYEGYLEERYVEIVKALVAAIREEDPTRLIFADGINIGQAPVLGAHHRPRRRSQGRLAPSRRTAYEFHRVGSQDARGDGGRGALVAPPSRRLSGDQLRAGSRDSRHDAGATWLPSLARDHPR